MALSILDGNQSATTLSTILSSGQHITAHTVVSLGTQAITDMRGAVSGSVVSISNLPATQTIAGTVTANAGGGFPAVIYSGILQYIDAEGAIPVGIGSALPAGTNRIGVVTIGGGTVTIGAGTAQIGSVTASISNSLTISSLPAISGTVTANGVGYNYEQVSYAPIPIRDDSNDQPFIAIGPSNRNNPQDSKPIPVVNESGGSLAISGTVTIGSALPAGTNRIGVVTIGAGTVTIGAGTAQIGSVTVGNSVTIGSLPAISGTVTANLAISSTAITSGSFSSLTSATLVPANTTRKMATVYNLGAGQLFVNAGATATTLGGGFMVALSSGDFYECDYTTTTLSAIFATAGTASWFSH
jgi:hypothetical protein